MNNVINNLNKRIYRRLKDGAVKQINIDALEKYKEYEQNKTVFEVSFTSCDADGTFSVYDGDILVVLSGRQMEQIKSNVNTYSLSDMLGVKMQLEVESIDYNKKIVYVDVAGKTRTEGMYAIRHAIQSSIKKSLKDNIKPLAWGKVFQISKEWATVDILGQGVIGFINADKWQDCYTRSLVGICKKNEYYQFYVEKPGTKRAGKETAWILSRVGIDGDPWKNVNYENLHEGSTMLVKCVEKPEGKTYWWGYSDRTPGITLMGNYSEKFGPSKGIYVGITYICKIKELKIGEDSRKNTLKVVPFAVIQDDMITFNNLQSVHKPMDNIVQIMNEE